MEQLVLAHGRDLNLSNTNPINQSLTVSNAYRDVRIQFSSKINGNYEDLHCSSDSCNSILITDINHSNLLKSGEDYNITVIAKDYLGDRTLNYSQIKNNINLTNPPVKFLFSVEERRSRGAI